MLALVCFSSLALRAWMRADIPGPGWGSQGTVYHLPNGEGVAKQMWSISCSVELAKALDRKLVVVPFLSGHYESPTSLEQYFDTRGEWRSLKPEDDTSVMNDPNKDCFFFSGNPSRTRWFTHRTAAGKFESFEFTNPEKVRAGNVAVSSVNQLRRKVVQWTHPTEYACVALLPLGSCSETNVYRVSQKVEDATSAARKKMFGSASQPFRALHLRRGDRCWEPESTASQRCKAMRDMPFLEWCGSNSQAPNERDHVPLYIATDETDEAELKVLHDAGCLTAKNLSDAAAATSSVNTMEDDPILTFLVEKELLIRADLSYTFGCSTTTTDVQHARRATGGSPLFLFDPSLSKFKRVSSDEFIRTGFGALKDCRAAGLGDLED